MRIFFLILLSGCSIFFSPKAPKTAKEDGYTIKFSSSNWIEKKDRNSDYIFENSKDGRVLLSNSFCNEFQDGTLENLAINTFKTLDGYKNSEGHYVTFDNREAYRLQGTGSVDGIKVGLKLLNTRRNNCYFDFVSISPLSTNQDDSDFENFLKSVVFK